jgi:hypothetical protein
MFILLIEIFFSEYGNTFNPLIILERRLRFLPGADSGAEAFNAFKEYAEKYGVDLITSFMVPDFVSVSSNIGTTK